VNLVASPYHLALDPYARAEGKPMPPLGPATVAAQIRRAGHPVALWDATFQPGPEGFARCLAGLRPARVLVFSDHHAIPAKMCLEAQTRAATAMIAMARAAGAEVAAAGPDATDRPAIYEEAGAHAVIRGEVDAPAVRWAGGAPLRGLAAGAAPPMDLTDLPSPAWDLVDLPEYRRRWRDRHGVWEAPVSAARGCPYRCNWCAKPIWGRTLKLREPAAVVADARDLGARGADRIWFTDDIFALKPSWLRRFRASVEGAGGIPRYRCLARADLLRDPSYADDLAATGCREVWIGAESGSDRVLASMDKDGTVEDIREATRRAHERGIRIGWFLQLGYPGETADDVRATRDLAREMAPDEVGISVSYPLPGTPFHDRVKDQLTATNWQTAMDNRVLFHAEHGQRFYDHAREVIRREHAVIQAAMAVRRFGRGGVSDVRRILAAPKHLARLPWEHLQLALAT
jgi:anaerobic magnesium-protoporphyrin IX monomethyl ester cyclase